MARRRQLEAKKFLSTDELISFAWLLSPEGRKRMIAVSLSADPSRNKFQLAVLFRKMV
jgi:hypothetical protein